VNDRGRPVEGLVRLRRAWALEEGGAPNPFWDALARAVSLGGTLEEKDLYCTPYPSTRFPKDLDPAQSLVVTRKQADVRSGPSHANARIDTLSYDVVSLVAAQGAQGEITSEWFKVRTPRGVEGFVHERDIRSPLDYTACFRRFGQGWLMTRFAAGLLHERSSEEHASQ
jgi:hypothetical protein